MKFKYLLPLFVMTMFTGCLSEEEILKSILGDPVAIADGDYESACIEDTETSGSSKTTVEIAGDSKSVQVDVYTSADCTTGVTLGSAEPFELSEFGFGNNTALMEVNHSTEGEIFIPYHVDGNGDLYVGASKDSIGEDPAEAFTDFIDAPTGSGSTKLDKLPDPS